jgi:hypothetical protein
MFDINFVPMLPAVPRLNGEFHAAVSENSGRLFYNSVVGLYDKRMPLQCPLVQGEQWIGHLAWQDVEMGRAGYSQPDDCCLDDLFYVPHHPYVNPSLPSENLRIGPWYDLQFGQR